MKRVTSVLLFFSMLCQRFICTVTRVSIRDCGSVGCDGDDADACDHGVLFQEGLLSSLSNLTSITLSRNKFEKYPTGGPSQFRSVYVSMNEREMKWGGGGRGQRNWEREGVWEKAATEGREDDERGRGHVDQLSLTQNVGLSWPVCHGSKICHHSCFSNT